MSELKDERKFIHDLASPVAAAIFTLDVALESLQAEAAADPRVLTDLGAVQKALERVSQLLQERRTLLMRSGNGGE